MINQNRSDEGYLDERQMIWVKMKKTVTSKRILLFLALISLIFAVAFVILFVWHFRPLIKTNDITAYLINGNQKEAVQVYTRLGFSEEYWISSSNDWFVFLPKKQRILIPNWPRRSPYLHFNHDMELGVAIDDEIKCDGEYLSRSDKSLIFRSGTNTYEIEL